MLEEIHQRIRLGSSFAFETTLSGRTYATVLQNCRMRGYHLLLIFLSLPTPDIAVARVAARVAQSGHNVPEEVIRRRFDLGRKNFDELYKPLVDSWVLYDNSGSIPKAISQGENR
jgi:predicted ABC-type ATPase